METSLWFLWYPLFWTNQDQTNCYRLWLTFMRFSTVNYTRISIWVRRINILIVASNNLILTNIRTKMGGMSEEGNMLKQSLQDSLGNSQEPKINYQIHQKSWKLVKNWRDEVRCGPVVLVLAKVTTQSPDQQTLLMCLTHPKYLFVKYLCVPGASGGWWSACCSCDNSRSM